jgi:hypothetical protein
MGLTMLEMLNRIYTTVDYMANLDGQDRTLVIDMSQAMLGDLIDNGTLQPMINYVKMFCDVIDGPEDAERIAEDI